MTSPLLARAGAFPADPPDEAVAAHYGDPFREQRRFVSGEGAVDLSHRPVVRVAGPDRLTWLHSLTSQHLETLAPGTATEALVLSPHGHVEHHLSLVDDGAATWMHVEPGTAESLVGYLASMRFWSKVEVEDLSSSYAVVHLPTGTATPAGVPSRATPS
ncbi:MAG: YgfZ/GcvT domain-containing protein, partial [Actinomycetes bacterium]